MQKTHYTYLIFRLFLQETVHLSQTLTHLTQDTDPEGDDDVSMTSTDLLVEAATAKATTTATATVDTATATVDTATATVDTATTAATNTQVS